MTLAVGKTWTDTVAEVQRRMGEFALPAAAFGFMPTLLVSRFADAVRVGETGAQAAQLLAGVIGVIGQAAIVVLVLFPKTDVGSAIRRAAAAAPRIVLASLAIAIAFVPVGYAFTLFGGKPSLMASMILLALALAALVVALRLSLLAPAIVAEDRSALGALRRSFALTEGNVGRILLLVGAIGLVFVIASGVTGAVGIAATGGTPKDPSFVTELLLAVVGAVFSTFLAVATAHIYRQLAE